MSPVRPKPNDSDSNVNILKKTISNMEAAEAAEEFAVGRERKTIKEKNERREESIKDLQYVIKEEEKSRNNDFS
ncbi:small, acid-soluble spore protein tlp [Sporosarcina sp. FA9]|uniref:small, acid-soluble spore protein tlp n=1 Tax=Sporosarcina sp. FA9 TaxID=3413030 RepID=UPI003F6601E0